MLRYEVRLGLNAELVPAVERYLRTRHIPEILGTGCFCEIRLDRLDATTLRTTYTAPDPASLERYLRDHAPRFRADFAAHFPSGAIPTREVWVEVQTWRP